MKTVLFTMSLAGTIALLCCVLFFRLTGKSMKAKWKRSLLLLTLAFYLLPFPFFKFILLQGGKALHIIPDTRAVTSGLQLLTDSPYKVFIDSAGRSYCSGSQTLLLIISNLLLLVSAVLLLYQFANYVRIKRAVRLRSGPAGEEEAKLLEELKVCMGIRRSIRLAQSEQIAVPVVSGVFSPMILLPKGMCAEDSAMRSMLLHELAHIMHQDILLQWIALLVVALHWYNPFSYLLLHLLTDANEQYSDAEAVARLGTHSVEKHGGQLGEKLGGHSVEKHGGQYDDPLTDKISEQEKRRYCEYLIDYAEKAGMKERSQVVLGFSRNAKKQIRGRMDAILNRKRKRPGIAICAAMFVLLLGISAAFLYQPPLTIKDTLPGRFDQQMFLEKEVTVYFKSLDSGTDGVTSVPSPLINNKEE